MNHPQISEHNAYERSLRDHLIKKGLLSAIASRPTLHMTGDDREAAKRHQREYWSDPWYFRDRSLTQIVAEETERTGGVRHEDLDL